MSRTAQDARSRKKRAWRLWLLPVAVLLALCAAYLVVTRLVWANGTEASAPAYEEAITPAAPTIAGWCAAAEQTLYIPASLSLEWVEGRIERDSAGFCYTGFDLLYSGYSFSLKEGAAHAYTLYWIDPRQSLLQGESSYIVRGSPLGDAGLPPRHIPAPQTTLALTADELVALLQQHHTGIVPDDIDSVSFTWKAESLVCSVVCGDDRRRVELPVGQG